MLNGVSRLVGRYGDGVDRGPAVYVSRKPQLPVYMIVVIAERACRRRDRNVLEANGVEQPPRRLMTGESRAGGNR